MPALPKVVKDKVRVFDFRHSSKASYSFQLLGQVESEIFIGCMTFSETIVVSFVNVYNGLVFGQQKDEMSSWSKIFLSYAVTEENSVRGKEVTF